MLHVTPNPQQIDATNHVASVTVEPSIPNDATREMFMEEVSCIFDTIQFNKDESIPDWEMPRILAAIRGLASKNEA